MKNQLIITTLFLFLSFSCLSQEIIREPKYKISLPQFRNLDSFYCKVNKCFYPLSSNLFVDSLDKKELSYSINADFIVKTDGKVLNFQPNLPYPIEFFEPLKKMSKLLFDESLFIPARLIKNRKKVSMKVRLYLSLHKNNVESFSINSYVNSKQTRYYDIKNKNCQ